MHGGAYVQTSGRMSARIPTFDRYLVHAYTYTYVYAATSSRGVRAHEGSSNEKPHYFLMHLLIDQSRKGSALPTLQSPLPSVNHSRNNLMIGAPVCLFRLPRCSCRGLLWRRALGNLFPLLMPHFSVYTPRVWYMPGRKRWPALAPDIYAEKRSIFADSRVLAYLAIERIRLLLDTKSDLRVHSYFCKRSSFTIAQLDEREKNRASYPRIISFECRDATPSQCTVGEYFRRNSRDKSWLAEDPRSTFSVDKKCSSRK